MPTTDLEVIKIVRRRDLDCACPLGWIGIVIGYDRDAPANEWENSMASNEMFVTLIAGMNGNAGIAQHRLRASGRDGDKAVVPLERIFEIPQIPFGFDLPHLNVSETGH